MEVEEIIARVRSTDELLTEIFDSHRFDIRNLRMSDLQRRLCRRMDVLEVVSLDDYLKYLKANPDEYEALFNAILVNTSQFFRDPSAWDSMRESVLPEILKHSNEIRIWSAGCASGEEAYSMAITLAETLGSDFPKRVVKIYATDINEASLKFARNGTYTLDQLNGIPEDIQRKYFTRHGNAFTIDKNIRRMLIFSHNNLVSDPPIPHIDLLLCRNVLIYLNRALQSRVIPKLQYALNDRGYLWLGESEILYTDAQKFKLIDPKHRIFRRIPVPLHPQFDAMIPADRYEKSYHINANGDFEEVIQNLKTGLILLNRDLNVAFCNQAFGRLCCLSSEQVHGKPFFDLAIAHCSIDLKHRIEHVLATGESSVVEDVEYWISNDNRVYLNVEIIPLTSGVIIFLEDTTKQHESREELRTMSRALDTAHERLLSTNKELKVANRQLEAINAALQSMNVELESINEELKATNEELNACVAKSGALDRYYEMLLNGTGSSLIVIDKKLTVKAWNGAPASTWGGEDVEFTGEPLMSLNIGIPLKNLAEQINNVIKTGGSAVSTLSCIDRQGKKIMVDVLTDMLMDEEPAELVLIIKKSSEQGNHPGTVDA